MTPEPCNKKIYKEGKTVAVLTGPSRLIEAIVREASRTGPEMDWHFAAGRAIVKTLGDVDTAYKELQAVMPNEHYSVRELK